MILPLNKRLWTVKFTPTQQEQEDRIIVYTPIVAIPAFVIISLEYESDREQAGAASVSA
jgi:hypothetical protein